MKVLEAELEEVRRAKTTVEEELNMERQKREKVSDHIYVVMWRLGECGMCVCVCMCVWHV